MRQLSKVKKRDVGKRRFHAPGGRGERVETFFNIPLVALAAKRVHGEDGVSVGARRLRSCELGADDVRRQRGMTCCLKPRVGQGGLF